MDTFAQAWGLDNQLLAESVEAFSISQPDEIPYIDELISSVDFAKTANQSAGNKLRHNMELITSFTCISGVKGKYSK